MFESAPVDPNPQNISGIAFHLMGGRLSPNFSPARQDDVRRAGHGLMTP